MGVNPELLFKELSSLQLSYTCLQWKRGAGISITTSLMRTARPKVSKRKLWLRSVSSYAHLSHLLLQNLMEYKVNLLFDIHRSICHQCYSHCHHHGKHFILNSSWFTFITLLTCFNGKFVDFNFQPLFFWVNQEGVQINKLNNKWKNNLQPLLLNSPSFQKSIWKKWNGLLFSLWI